MLTVLPCPLCEAATESLFHRDGRRSYYRCGHCALVFVPPAERLSLLAERAEYDKHENAVDDPGYRRFLSRLSEPLLDLLPPGSAGLDFGCGPGPALAAILSEAGHEVTLYDSYYQPEARVLLSSYDFIVATEVVEHLHRPGEELTRLWSLLRPGGWLGVMTKLVIDREAFSRWHYKNDQTHVVFFSRATWEWWARQQGAKLRFVGNDVMLLAKPR